jgi:S-DNA-T family DNA segregation ATPase FtsK/SpoIIIE
LSYSNQYKSQVGDIAKKKKTNQTQADRKSMPLGLGIDKILGFFQDDRTRNILGVFLLILSGVLLLSMTSYLFTWKIDQDHIIDSSFGDVATNPDMEIENWLGTIGAFLGHTLIFKGFGIGSLVFVLITFLSGIKVLFRVDLLPLW